MISQKKTPTNHLKPHLLIFMTFNKYLRAATGVKSITHQLSSHHHPALPASDGPIAPRGVVLSSAGPTSTGTSQSPRPMQKQQEFSTSMETRFSVSVGRGFGTRGGLVDLAEGLRIREEDWHTRSMSHKRQLMPWGKERSQGGPGAPQGRGCQPSCPGAAGGRGLSVFVAGLLSLRCSHGTRHSACPPGTGGHGWQKRRDLGGGREGHGPCGCRWGAGVGGGTDPGIAKRAMHWQGMLVLPALPRKVTTSALRDSAAVGAWQSTLPNLI